MNCGDFCRMESQLLLEEEVGILSTQSYIVVPLCWDTPLLQHFALCSKIVIEFIEEKSPSRRECHVFRVNYRFYTLENFYY